MSTKPAHTAPSASISPTQPPASDIKSGLWGKPMVIAPTGFRHKSLADFMLNNFVGCSHGCTFCYVPEISALKLKRPLAKLGVTDPDAQWGEFQFLRPFDLEAFLRSLRDAQYRPAHLLIHGGHRAVFISSTTDAWGPIQHPDKEHQRALSRYRDECLTKALELIRDRTDLKVRILTRSYHVKQGGFFPLLKSFGNRLMLGTSLPCLNESLLRAYEPLASAPAARLRMLNEARDAGIPTYAAIAPVYPEMTNDELREVMEAVRDAGVLTAFMEPIHIRAGNVERIQRGFQNTGITSRHEVFSTLAANVRYSMEKFAAAERIAVEVGIADRLHLWPDQGLLESAAAREVIPDWDAHTAWLHKWWNRVSEWPELGPIDADVD